MRAMDKNAALAGQIREWLRGVMEETGLSVTNWAKAADVARTTIARPLGEDYEFVTSSRTLQKLADGAGVEPPNLTAAPTRIRGNFLPVRYRVQAGHWIEQDAYAQSFSGPERPVSPDPRYTGMQQWLEEVVGDSIDREISPGSFAHVVDAIDMGYEPAHNDFVVVERKRDGGHLCERSIKQIVVTQDGEIQLWPRSYNPAWCKPLSMTDGAGDGEEVEVSIVGVVIGAYRGMR